MRWLPLLVVLGLFSCDGGDADGDAAAAGCDACSEDEFCLIVFAEDDDGEDTEECVALPSGCAGESGDCAVQECISNMYDACPEDTIGVGCSDTTAPALVSCNY